MKVLTQFFSGNPIAVVIIFLLIFAAIIYGFARDKYRAFFLGLLKVFAALFIAPINYLKKAIIGLADYGKNGKDEFAGTKQYLTSKILIMLQSLVIVLSITILSGGIVRSWKVLVPPIELRMQIKGLKGQIASNKKELLVLEPKVNRMQKLWTNKRDSLFDAFISGREQKIQMLEAENNQIDSLITLKNRNTRYQFRELKNWLEQSRYGYSFERVNEVTSRTKVYANRNFDDQETKTRAIKYIENWQALMLAKMDYNILLPTQQRVLIQPNFVSDSLKIKELPEHINQLEEQLKTAKSAAKLNFPGFLLALIIGFIVFLITIWLLGLLVEGLGIGLFLAQHVQKISEQR